MKTPVEIAGALYDAINENDMPAIMALYAPDVRISQSDALPWGGDYEGLAGLARFGAALRLHIDSKVTIERLIEAGEDVVVLGRTIGKAKKTKATFNVAVVHVLTVRNAKIVRAQYFIDTPAMQKALKG